MILKGNKVKEYLLKDLKEKYKDVSLSLAVIDINESSIVYTNSLKRLSKLLNVEFNLYNITNPTTSSILTLIDTLNNDSNINGIIICLPLPNYIDFNTIRNRISKEKDIEGINDLNRIDLINGCPTFIPPTTLSILKLLDYYNIDPSNKNITLIGRSIHIGRPLAHILLEKNATISICHSNTKDLSFYTKHSDIIITCVGKKNLITSDMVSKESIVIDVGFNISNGIISGDVEEGLNVKHLSPTPGGVGEVNACCVYENLYKTFANSNKL